MTSKSLRIKKEINDKKADLAVAKHALRSSHNNPVRALEEAEKRQRIYTESIKNLRENESSFRYKSDHFVYTWKRERRWNEHHDAIDNHVFDQVERTAKRDSVSDYSEGNKADMLKDFSLLIEKENDRLSKARADVARLKPAANDLSKKAQDIQNDIERLEDKYQSALADERAESNQNYIDRAEVNNRNLIERQEAQFSIDQEKEKARNAHELEVLRLRGELLDKERELEKMRRSNFEESVDDMDSFFDDVLKGR